MEGSYNLHYVLLFAYIYNPANRFEQLIIIKHEHLFIYKLAKPRHIVTRRSQSRLLKKCPKIRDIGVEIR